MIRARRLHRYLTQPFHVAESFTGVPGVRMSLRQTLAGCREIIEGRCDDVPEEAFHFSGSLEDIRSKAKAEARSER